MIQLPFNNVDYKETHKPHGGDKLAYRLIILIIASRTPHYDEFKKCWDVYASKFPEVKCFFLYSDPSIKADVIVDKDTITHKYEEWYEPGILFKTIAGMEMCSQLFHYDYLLRTNLSSFIHIPRILEFLKTQPTSNYIAAKTNIYREGVVCLSGAGFILSRDVVQSFLRVITENRITNDVIQLPDDVAISKILEDYVKIEKFTEILRYDCEEVTLPESIPNHIFHIRNKTEWKYHHREIDIENMTRQIAYFYNV